MKCPHCNSLLTKAEAGGEDCPVCSRPLDVAADGLRIRSYIWADQPHRMALTQTAIDLAQGIRVERGDAVAWLETRLASPMPGR